MFGILFKLFVLYGVYKLVFDFIIPTFIMTKQIKSDLNKMKQNQFFGNEHNQPKQNVKKQNTNKGDYIDFEEIKK